MTKEYYYAPIDGFLVFLVQGWSLQFVVEPMHGHHGFYSVLVWRHA